MSILLARYNRWMNERIYDVCEQLSDKERKLDRGAFFKSIHGTLNHILLGDKVWLARFHGEVFSVPGLDCELLADFHDLREARATLDTAIETWAAGLTADILASTIEYTSIVDSKQHKYPMSVAVTHYFNHQTHHRGQITTLLNQCGLDYGGTDLIGMPNLSN